MRAFGMWLGLFTGICLGAAGLAAPDPASPMTAFGTSPPAPLDEQPPDGDDNPSEPADDTREERTVDTDDVVPRSCETLAAAGKASHRFEHEQREGYHFDGGEGVYRPPERTEA